MEEKLDSYFAKVIGAIQGEIMGNSSHPIMSVFGEKGKVVDLMAIGVKKEYAGRKIGRKLMEVGYQKVKEKGFQYGYGFSCDARSRHLALKYGCTSMGKI